MKKISLLLVAVAVLACLSYVGIRHANADSNSITFEPPAYHTGSPNGQDGWVSLGSAGNGCATYDHAIASTPSFFGAPASFGSQSLRISNAVTSGCFGDQTFSKPLANEAGETSAQSDGLSSGPRQKHFEAQWDFASTTPGSEQPGLSVVASPDRGDGARMSWVQMADTPGGLEVNFYDYQRGRTVDPCGCCPPFGCTTVAAGLNRTVPHNVKVTMDFVDGDSNDVVKVFVDGVLKHTGTSWEDYYRDEEGNPTRTVDSILFRTGGAAAPATMGFGFLVDNFSLRSGTPPANKDQCKGNGWQSLSRTDGSPFKNQGDCVQYANTGK